MNNRVVYAACDEKYYYDHAKHMAESAARFGEKLGWDYSMTLEEGIEKTYKWIKEQIDHGRSKNI